MATRQGLGRAIALAARLGRAARGGSALRRYESGMPILPPRWSEEVRAMSRVTAVDDPPTQPLPQQHDLGEGEADFSNWLGKFNDASLGEALAGWSAFFVLGAALYAVTGSVEYEAWTTPRELPYLKEDLGGHVEDPHELRRVSA